MIVRKVGNTILGATLTKKEEKAMKIEIMKQLAEYDKKNCREIDALVLWVLHCLTGFGYARLKRFYFLFDPCLRKFIQEYELAEADDVWFCTKLLNTKFGINLENWEHEVESLDYEAIRANHNEEHISFEEMVKNLQQIAKDEQHESQRKSGTPKN